MRTDVWGSGSSGAGPPASLSPPPPAPEGSPAWALGVGAGCYLTAGLLLTGRREVAGDGTPHHGSQWITAGPIRRRVSPASSRPATSPRQSRAPLSQSSLTTEQKKRAAVWRRLVGTPPQSGGLSDGCSRFSFCYSQTQAGVPTPRRDKGTQGPLKTRLRPKLANTLQHILQPVLDTECMTEQCVSGEALQLSKTDECRSHPGRPGGAFALRPSAAREPPGVSSGERAGGELCPPAHLALR
ncbi:unnamed protein product [Arctogadus glacialis]